MADNENKLEGKLVESLEVKELGSLSADYTELGLDSILDDGIVKDIPILRTLVSFAKIGLNVRDRIYVKKICGFLAQVGQTTQEQRVQFIQDNCQDVKQFEEAILLILEQADRIEKTSLIGKIFKACILGKIKYSSALLLSDMVNKAYWMDLLCMFRTETSEDEEQRLFSTGLFEEVEPISFGSHKSEMEEAEYEETEYETSIYANVLIRIHNCEYEKISGTYLS